MTPALAAFALTLLAAIALALVVAVALALVAAKNPDGLPEKIILQSPVTATKTTAMKILGLWMSYIMSAEHP